MMMHTYRHPEIDNLWTQRFTLDMWTAVEQATAAAQAVHGLIPDEAADAISQTKPPPVGEVHRHEKRTHHDVAAFVAAFAESTYAVGRPYVHLGLTSSDLVDTGNALRATRINEILSATSWHLAETLLTLARTHRDTPRLARTHGQAAEPTSFGIQLHRLSIRVSRARYGLERNPLPMKLSGAVGQYTYNPPEIENAVMRHFNLPADGAATQVVGRDYYAAWAFTMVQLAGAVESIATEIRLAAQSGIDEIREGFGDEQVGSTAMPHKRNPIRSERLCGLARVAFGFLHPIFSTANGLWGERDISNSSVERESLRSLSGLVGWMVTECADLVANLEIRHDRMGSNLARELDLPTPAARLWMSQRLGASRDEATRQIQENAAILVGSRVDDQGVWADETLAREPEWYWRNHPALPGRHGGG